MTQYAKPLPDITALTQPFWDGTKAHQLRIQRCDDCGTFRFIPREVCPQCASVNATWTPVSGKGTLYTYSIVYRAPNPAFQADVPYVVAQVLLAEGPRIMSHLVGCPLDQVRVGMPVEVFFEDVTPQVTLYKFRPA